MLKYEHKPVLENKTATTPNSNGVPPVEPTCSKDITSATSENGESGRNLGTSARTSARDPSDDEWLKYIDLKGLSDAKEGELRDLIQMCRPGVNAEPARENIERQLHSLLWTESQGSSALSWDFSKKTWPVEDRGRLYSSLLAIASNQHLQLSKATAEGIRSLSLSHLKAANRKLRRSTLIGDQSPTSIAWVLWEIIEKDEDFMTLVLAPPSQFRYYPVPYFQGCDQKLVDKISNLWLPPSGDNEFGVVNFYKHVVFKPMVVEELRSENLTRNYWQMITSPRQGKTCVWLY